MTLMNNNFMNLAQEDNIPCVEEILRVILKKQDLVVKTARTQKFFQGFKRSVYLDVFAEDSKDELGDALKSLYESNEKDCRVSIAEFREKKLGQSYVASIKAFYLKLPKTKKFNPSTTNDGVNMILDYCRACEPPSTKVEGFERIKILVQEVWF